MHPVAADAPPAAASAAENAANLTQSSPAPHVIATACRNCGHTFGDATPAYCPACGQDTHPHPPSAWEFMHEFITHYVALEGKLWKTLGLLFFKPGELTKQFSLGKKLRYVHPLRLYITASFIFFLVVKVAGFGNIVQVNTNAEPSPDKPAFTSKSESKSDKPAAADTIVPKEIAGAPTAIEFGCHESDGLCKWAESHIKKKWSGKTSGDVINVMKQAVYSNLPYAMFFMLPVFACMTYWLYWRRKLMFGEHMVYAMHVHAFAYFSLLAKALLPQMPGDILLLASMVWYFIAMQRFFGGRLWVTALRYGVVATFYPLFLTLLTTFVIALALVF